MTSRALITGITGQDGPYLAELPLLITLEHDLREAGVERALVDADPAA